MESTPLTRYACLPRTYQGLHMMSSTIDAYGRAHWLMGEHIPVRRGPCARALEVPLL
ncbi:hypothetical protein [Streptomyces sp. NPDC051286]|uniref:hypothetical protein n=1 Tax=Streptomyces sp. NPDC051286 TaxID=3365647 RepID=UPI00378A99A5